MPSRQNIESADMIRAGGISASHTPEALILPVPLSDVAAFRARPRRVPRGHDIATAPSLLVFQHEPESVPALIEMALFKDRGMDHDLAA